MLEQHFTLDWTRPGPMPGVGDKVDLGVIGSGTVIETRFTHVEKSIPVLSESGVPKGGIVSADDENRKVTVLLRERFE